MTTLGSRPAQPRLRRSNPGYPRAAVASVAVVALSAACSPLQEAPRPTTSGETAPVAAVVAAESPKEPMVLAAEGEPASIAGSGMHFPEDDAPLDENIGCRGDCPAPWVMAISRKDRNQIEARIRYCDRAARDRGERNDGFLAATAFIDAEGRAQQVTLEPSGTVSESVSSCVRGLVESAPFTAERDHARKSYGTGPVGP